MGYVTATLAILHLILTIAAQRNQVAERPLLRASAVVGVLTAAAAVITLLTA